MKKNLRIVARSVSPRPPVPARSTSRAPRVAALPAPATERTATETTRPGVGAVEPYRTKREVAELLGRTTRCVENLMRRGMIPYYKLGYRVAFRWSEIQSHLAQTCRVCHRPEGPTP